MKKLFQILVIAAISLTTLSATAAQKESKKQVALTTQMYQADIDCESCTKKVMNTLPYEKGIKDVEVDLKKKIITVSYDANKSSDKAIIKALAKLKIDSKVYVVSSQSNKTPNTTTNNKR